MKAWLGKKVIVRSADAGAIYGVFMGNDGDTVHLHNARQLWRWYAVKGISLMDVAEYGAGPKSAFSEARVRVIVFKVCAMIEVSDEAAASIEAI